MKRKQKFKIQILVLKKKEFIDFILFDILIYGTQVDRKYLFSQI